MCVEENLVWNRFGAEYVVRCRQCGAQTTVTGSGGVDEAFEQGAKELRAYKCSDAEEVLRRRAVARGMSVRPPIRWDRSGGAS